MTSKKTTNRILLLLVLLLIIIVAIPPAFMMMFYSENYSIDLIGDEVMDLGLNSVYEDPGAEAKANGRDSSEDIVVSGNVDTSVPGTYEITYSAHNMSKTRTVYVGTTMDPSIQLKGDSALTINLGDEYVETGFSASDDDGQDLTKKVIVDTSELNRAGSRHIYYTVADADGNTTKVSREINILPNTDYSTPGLPICMFHYVYDENDPPEDLHKRYGNYISAQALEEEINWLKSEDYYFPDWDEVRDYIDGKLLLPEKSVVLTFDDGEMSFLQEGIPVLERCRVPATSFLITKNRGAEKAMRFASEYVTFQSHTHNMHRTGGNVGHGGIFTVLPFDEALADLKQSIELCGNGDAFAYPYGDYNDATHLALEAAGFKCAVTTQPGKAKPGDDPLLLPRQRMSLGQTLQSFQNKVQP